jgi:hypothetical protein
MPKEISHWLLAEETARRLPAGPIRASIDAHPGLYELGAVVFDSAFYAVWYGNAAEATRASLRLHGIDGEDTYEPLRRLLMSELAGRPVGEKDAKPSTLSFIAGCVTHVMGDTHFHPLVNFFSGKYYAEDPVDRDRSQRRHRRFEAALDRHLLRASAKELRNGGKFSRTLADARAAVAHRLETLVAGLYYGPGGPSRAAMMPLLRQHAAFQRLFASATAARSARSIGSFLGGGAARVAAAFYRPDPPEGYALFRGAIEYHHPNTGERRRESVAELFDRTAADGAAVLATLGEWVESGDAAADPFGGRRGASLEVGCDLHEHPDLVHTDTATPMDELLGAVR